MTTPRLGAPELVQNQAAPETTVNEQVRYLEAGTGHFILEDRDLATPPGSPTDGQTYLVAASPTGAWTGHAGDIAYRLNTAWIFIDVQEGFTFWVKDENVYLVATSASTFATFSSSANNPTESIILAPSDETTALSTGTAKITFRMPYAFTLTGIRASLTTAQTSGSIFTVDVNEGGTTILSTKITIDNGEKTSTTAATAPVLSDTALADDAEITVDIDQIGDGTAKGLKVVLIGHQ